MSERLKRILCRLGFHADWKQITDWKAIKDDKPFHEKRLIGFYALGECGRCGFREPRKMYGTFTYNPYRMVTLDEAVKEWNALLKAGE